MTMTYGVMPTREQFDRAWDGREEPLDELGFGFGNDPRVGSCRMSRSELWAEVTKAHAEYDAGDEASGDWCSAVLGCLGFEWV